MLISTLDCIEFPGSESKVIMAKCQVCDKSGMWGHNVSHSKRRTNKRWAANVHPLRVEDKGRARKLMVCTRCLRSYQNGKLKILQALP